jgi:3',5'-cyclic AMP phosphodiesterase CpdA
VYYAAGGDSRDDAAGVIPWAFGEARRRQVAAFLYLGDMELSPELDGNFRTDDLGGIPFYPVLGNHEIKLFGAFAVHWKVLDALSQAHDEREFRKRFLWKTCTPVQSAFRDKVVYSTDLPGGVHFVALDNVSQKGFGEEQHGWLAADLERAHANPLVRHIVVGMHKALARNGVTTHSMDEDCPQGLEDTEWALPLFKATGVELILASHEHLYAKFEQGGIPAYITGGLGAPLHTASGPAAAFHHFLVLDVTDAGISVEAVPFRGDPTPTPESTDD